jgi:hypothetical protein
MIIRNLAMKNIWKLATKCVLWAGISLLGVGCGNKDPEEKRISIDLPIEVNHSVSTSSALSSSPLSNVGSSAPSIVKGGAAEYTISVEKLEFIEGSHPEANKIFPVTFTFNKPLEDDATIYIKLYANFGTGVYPGKLSPAGAIPLKKGTSTFSVQFESYVNSKPESTKTADWVIDASINGESKRLQVDNNVVINDDDKMASKEIITTAGKLVEWDVNGIEKQDTGDKYTITQESGAAAAFEVHADKLRILVPAPNNYTGVAPDGMDLGDLKFQVVSSQGENYELSLPFFKSTRFKLISADFDYEGYGPDEGAPIYNSHYLQKVNISSGGPHHLIQDTYGPPVIELVYLNSNIKISGDVSFSFRKLNPGAALGAVNAEVDDDGKTLKISKSDWEEIKKKIDLRDSGVTLEATINLRDSVIENASDTENYFGQDFNLIIRFRVADKTAAVTVDNSVPDSAFKSGNIFLVLRDNYDDAPGDGVVIIKPLTQRVTEFDYLYGSDFDVSIADLSGQYSGSTNIPLDDKVVMSKAVTIVASSKPK